MLDFREYNKENLVISKERNLIVREAKLDDVDKLLKIAKRNRVFFEDRIRETIEGDALKLFVAELEKKVVGFGMIVFKQPSNWSPRHSLPQIIDLNILENLRGKGIGSKFIKILIDVTRESGEKKLYIGADMGGNPRTLELYKRLGFEQIDSESRVDKWKFVDSKGETFEGEDRAIYLEMNL